LRDLLGDPSGQGIFTFRLGYPTEHVPSSRRRAVRDVVGRTPSARPYVVERSPPPAPPGPAIPSKASIMG
jgi:hypothetical protein